MTATGRLSGRVSIVTGSSMGIGLAVARRFLDEGALVVVNSRDRERAVAAAAQLGAPGRVLAIEGDVAREDDVERLFARVDDELGRVDVLVNNAGIPTVAQSEQLDTRIWQRCVDVDLTGAFNCARAAGARMIGQRSGSIVNVASVAGRVGIPYRAAYGAAKSGLLGLTQTLAAEWAQHNVRVNAVAPAFVRTPMTALIEEAGGTRGDWSVATINDRTPLGRMGEATEVAAAVAFLASDDASYITGVTLPVDGGWLCYGGWNVAARPPLPEPTRLAAPDELAPRPAS